MRHIAHLSELKKQLTAARVELSELQERLTTGFKDEDKACTKHQAKIADIRKEIEQRESEIKSFIANDQTVALMLRDKNLNEPSFKNVLIEALNELEISELDNDLESLGFFIHSPDYIKTSDQIQTLTRTIIELENVINEISNGRRVQLLINDSINDDSEVDMQNVLTPFLELYKKTHLESRRPHK